MNNEARKKVAKELLAVAKDLEGASRPTTAADVTKELEETAKACSKLAEEFKDTHASLIDEMNKADKKHKDLKSVLSGYYKDWNKKSGYNAVKKSVLVQAQECLDTGEVLEDLADNLILSKEKSQQASYQQKLNILLSMLNAAEMKKYEGLLKKYFNKNLTDLKVGLSNLDGTVKEWHKEAQAIAEERGIKLPKASKMASAMDRAKERNAGILDALMDALKSIIPTLVRKIQDWGKRFLRTINRNGEELDDITSELTVMTARAQGLLD